jgi:hypothetical protein
MVHWPNSRRPTACDNHTLWSLHLLVAQNDRARGDAEAAARSMRSARAHAAARKLTARGL